MNGGDWIVVAVLGTVLVAVLVFDWFVRRNDRNER